MPALADEAVQRVVAAFGVQTATIRQRVTAYVSQSWGHLSSYRDADIEAFVQAITPMIEGGQLQIASLTDGYLSALESVLFGSAVQPIGIPPSLVTDQVMRGVATTEVYARTGPTVWKALKDGADVPTAARLGLDRALSLASTDMQLAKTHAARHVMSAKPHIIGFRRTLTGSHSCGLCIVASTQTYRKQNLLPIHPGCDCGTLPIYTGKDPGRVVDLDNLEGVHEAISQRFGAFDSGARDIPGVAHPSGDPLQYRDVLVTHLHGEIGPVLGVRGQKFTSPSDL